MHDPKECMYCATAAVLDVIRDYQELMQSLRNAAEQQAIRMTQGKSLLEKLKVSSALENDIKRIDWLGEEVTEFYNKIGGQMNRWRDQDFDMADTGPTREELH